MLGLTLLAIGDTDIGRHDGGENTMATPEIALLALIIAGFAMAPAGTPEPGKRVDAESFTAPPELARCITHNIGKKMPHLSVRQRTDATAEDRILLVISEPGPTTFGVIRVDPDESGSKLTTWFAARDLPAPADAVAKRLVGGC